MPRYILCYILLSIAVCAQVNAAALPQSTSSDAPAKSEPAPANDETAEPLSKEEAQQRVQQLTEAYLQKIRDSRKAEWDAKSIAIDDYTMKFDFRVFGDKPENGRSLFISMHGGGSAPARVNEQQWKNQIGLYKPAEGIYLAPRAPTDSWNMWHQEHIDQFFARIIEDAVAIEDVNPNRIYLLGYSAGGDGVYQMAPRMADQLAAASMMAGHPNGASGINLRNIGFTIHMGGKDAAYKRNKVAAQWKEKLAKLQEQDPQGYQHEVTIYPQHGHWMNRDDAVAIPWMEKFNRNPIPQKVAWRQSNIKDDRFYWLAAGENDQKNGAQMIVRRDGNRFTIEETKDVKKVIIRLNDAMVDFSQPIEVAQQSADGKVTVKTFANVRRRSEVIEKTIAGRGDIHSVFTAEIEVDVAP